VIVRGTFVPGVGFGVGVARVGAGVKASVFAVAVGVRVAPRVLDAEPAPLAPVRNGTLAKATEAISRTAAMAPRTTRPELRRRPSSRRYGGGATA
jgi:hypothetical protein